jgi:hypothetical protein
VIGPTIPDYPIGKLWIISPIAATMIAGHKQVKMQPIIASRFPLNCVAERFTRFNSMIWITNAMIWLAKKVTTPRVSLVPSSRLFDVDKAAAAIANGPLRIPRVIEAIAALLNRIGLPYGRITGAGLSGRFSVISACLQVALTAANARFAAAIVR